jgi:hypothetical protein
MNQRKLAARWILSFACSTLLACNGGSGDGGTGSGGTSQTGGNTGNSGSTGSGGASATGGSTGTGGAVSTGGSVGTGGAGTGGSVGAGGSSATGGSAGGRGGTTGSGQAGAGGKGTGGVTGTGGAAGARGSGGATATGGAGGKATGGTNGTGGTSTGGQGGSTSCTVAPGSVIGTLTDPVTATTIAPPNPPGISFKDTDGNLVDAHGGGIIKVCDTYYLHGEYFLSTTTDNNFNGFSMYSSKDMATWKNEGIILPQQASGSLLGPNRKGERPHIIQCPSSGEFVLYAHAADTTYQADKEVVYATASKVTGPYTFKGALTSTGASASCQVTTVPPSSCSGSIAAHSDMSALTDGNSAYVITESGVVYTLAADCHSWASNKSYGTVNGTTGGIEAPTVFKADSTFYWIGSDKTGWRANDDFYSTAPAMSGPWTYQGYLAPEGALTWMTQSTWVMPIVGSAGTTYVYWGDHWYGNQDTTQPGKHNNLATFVFQPIVFNGTKISLPTYQVSWKLDVGAGTWTPN